MMQKDKNILAKLPVLPTSAEIQATFAKVSQKGRLDNVFAGFSKSIPTTSKFAYKSRNPLAHNGPPDIPKLDVREIGIDLNHEYIKNDPTFSELNNWRKQNSEPGAKSKNTTLKANKFALEPALFRLQKNAQAKMGKNFFGDVEKIARELDSVTKSVRLSIKSELGENIGKRNALIENPQKVKTFTVASYNVEKKRAMDEATKKTNEAIRNISRKLELKKKLSEERRRKMGESTFSSIAGSKQAKSILKPPKSKFLEKISKDFQDSLSAVVKNPREAIRTPRSFNRAQVLTKGTITSLAPPRHIKTDSSRSVKFSNITAKLNESSDPFFLAKERTDPLIKLELLKTRTNDKSYQGVQAFQEYSEREKDFNIKIMNKRFNNSSTKTLRGFIRDRDRPQQSTGAGLELERKAEETGIANLIQPRSLLRTMARNDDDKGTLALSQTYDRFRSANLNAKDNYKKILTGGKKADANYDYSTRNEVEPDNVVLEKFKEFNLHDSDKSPRGKKF